MNKMDNLIESLDSSTLVKDIKANEESRQANPTAQTILR